ncbi:MAG: type II secretion system F family protein [Betaproteobacteria bacterium]
MSTIQLAFLALVFVGVVAALAGISAMARPDAARQRLLDLSRTTPAGPASPASSRWLQRLAALVRPISRLSTPEEGFEKSSIRMRFLHAGVRSPTAPTAFFGTKTALALGLPLLGLGVLTLADATLRGQSFLLAMLALAAMGYYLPNFMLSRAVQHRQLEIFESFPDALDMMTVCVEAGLGTEAAMVRVADDLQFKSPALAEELRLVNLELRAGADRERALRNLALRTGVEEVDGFVTMVSQAERFGTSIAASLRVHADTLRTVRRQRAEEAAAKIALKLLFPLIFCIFPSLMVVLMGPAMIQIYRVLLPSMGTH